MNRSFTSRIVAPLVLLLACGGCGASVEQRAEPIRLGGFEPWAEPIPDALAVGEAAFDGDFDRCFFFDGQGRFIEGYYIVGLLAEAFLSKEKGAKVVHDPRLTWNTIDIAKQLDGVAVIDRKSVV